MRTAFPAVRPGLVRRRLPLKLVVAVVMALMAGATYFGSSTKNEITGEKQHVQLSPEQEIKLGLAAAPEMAQQFGGEVQDERVAPYVDEVGNRVVESSAARRAPYRYEFHLLRDPETVNAFALPGGQVFITVGLLKRLRNEAQLAGVLGHEVGHVVARHGAEHLAKQQFAQTLVGAFTVATYDEDDASRSQQRAAVAAAVAQLVTLKYGRDDELESDRLGVRFMKEAGYSPRGMVELMEILGEASSRRPIEFTSTHPNPENRVARLREMIDDDRGEMGAERFRQRIGDSRP